MSKETTRKAARILRDKNSTADEKSTAASVLGKSRDKTTVKEAVSVSPVADLIDHVKEFVKDWAKGEVDADAFGEIFAADLERLRSPVEAISPDLIEDLGGLIERE